MVDTNIKCLILADETVQFGGIVSTSNSYACTNTKIDCDQYLFWSTATDDEQEDLH